MALADGFTRAELLERAARSGAAVSVTQLHRWRDAGVIRPPIVVHPIGHAGSRSIYGHEQLRRLVFVHGLVGEGTPLRHILVRIWWEGGWVDGGLLRKALQAQPQEIQEAARLSLRRCDGDPLDAAEALAEAIERSMRTASDWGHLARHLGRRPEDRRAALVGMLQVAFGGEASWAVGDKDAASPIALIERWLGIDVARTSDAERALWHDVDIREELTNILVRGPLAVLTIADQLSRASNAELESSRCGVRALLSEVAAVIEAGGSPLESFKTFSALAEPQTPIGYAVLVLLGLYLIREGRLSAYWG